MCRGLSHTSLFIVLSDVVLRGGVRVQVSFFSFLSLPFMVVCHSFHHHLLLLTIPCMFASCFIQVRHLDLKLWSPEGLLPQEFPSRLKLTVRWWTRYLCALWRPFIEISIHISIDSTRSTSLPKRLFLCCLFRLFVHCTSHLQSHRLWAYCSEASFNIQVSNSTLL